MPQKITTIVKRTKRSKRNVKKTIKRVTSKKRRTRRTKKNKMRMSAALAEGIRLIADPCSGPITRAVGPAGLVERLRLTYTATQTAGNINGYMVWFPTYHNTGATGKVSNLFYFENASSAVAPINTNPNPTGMVASGTTGTFLADPAQGLVAGTVFSRAKTLSACMQIEYVAALSLASGQIAVIKNYPLKGFYRNITANTIAAPTVDELFAFASIRERLPLDGQEVIWRPSDVTSVYRTGGAERGAAVITTDAAFSNGVVGTSTSSFSAADPDNQYGIVIAWRGVPDILQCVSLNLVKTVALELVPNAPFVEPTFAGSKELEEGPLPVEHSTSWLDTHIPNWQSHAMKMAGKGANLGLDLISKVYAPTGRLAPIRASNLRGNDDWLAIDNW